MITIPLFWILAGLTVIVWLIYGVRSIWRRGWDDIALAMVATALTYLSVIFYGIWGIIWLWNHINFV